MSDRPPVPEPGATGLSVYLAHVDAAGEPARRSPTAIHADLAARDRVGVHRLVDAPEDADVILFTEAHLILDWRLQAIADHPLRRRFPERCYCFNERSWPWGVLPGLYTSPPAATVDRRYQVPWGYPGPSEVGDLLFAARDTLAADLLFSFVGSPGPACRQRLFTVRAPRAVIERVDNFTFFDPTSPGFEERRARYQEVTLRSKFVLCPRGKATSSIRLYETLAAGRVPVIFSDQWLAPEGPDWDAFSIRWPEADAERIGDHLAGREDDWPEMAARAAEAFDRWFAPDMAFHQAMQALRPLVARAAAADFPRKGLRNRQFFTVGARSIRDRGRANAVRARNRLRACLRAA